MNLLRINRVLDDVQLAQAQDMFQSELAAQFRGQDSAELRDNGSPAAFEFGDAVSPVDRPADFLDWLLKKQLITGLQHEVLTSGKNPRFVFGDYLILHQITPNLSNVCAGYVAKCLRCGHEVELHFLAGSSQDDRARWTKLVDWANRRRQIQSSNLFSIYETVLLPEHRFLVTELSWGRPLSETVPIRSRLPWKTVLKISGYLATALYDLHRAGVHHENLWPGNIFLTNDSKAVLRLDFVANLNWPPGIQAQQAADQTSIESPEAYHSDDAIDENSDWYSLGCVMYRMLSGKPPRWIRNEETRRRHVNALAKLEIPQPVCQLVHDLTLTEANQSCDGESMLGRIRQLTQKDEFRIPDKSRPSTHFKLLQLIREWTETALPSPEDFSSLGKTRADIAWDPLTIPIAATQSTDGTLTNAVGSGRKSRRRKLVNYLLASGTAVAACLIGSLFVAWGLGMFDSIEPVATTPEQVAKPPNSVSEERASGTNTADEGKSSLGSTSHGPLVQSLRENDDSLPWESPTSHVPIDWAYMPSAPDFVFVIRPAALLGSEEGKLALRALGDQFNASLQDWETRAGVEFADIERLVISLHSDGTRDYQVCYHAWLQQPVQLAELRQRWAADIDHEVAEGNSDSKHLDSDQNSADVESEGEQPPSPKSANIFCGSIDYGYWVEFLSSGEQLESDRSNATVEPRPSVQADDQKVIAFTMADKQFLKQSINKGLVPLGGIMGRLSRRCDADRHFSLFFIVKILSNEPSESLFAGPLAELRRPTMFFFDDRVEGVLFSLHVEEDCYWELLFDRSSDIRADELGKLVDEQLRKTRDQLIEHVASMPSVDYWNSVKVRWPSMLQFVYSYTRTGVERGETIVNGWLPGPSLHNLLASSEIILSMGSATGTDIVDTVNNPSTLDELLQRKRTLQITSRPDLVNLVQDLQNEIRDDFSDLPFKFEIKLAGADLEAEGITQNQRPGDIVMVDKTLEEILTEICFQANPDKNATSPADERCKLVWVTQRSEAAEEPAIILITTRAAAKKRGDDLPVGFRSP
ncbi:MAG TPA: protein kinase [Pirellulaceae bacterium]|nr:protein kinase [Pirellulaceae bacterium]